MRTDVRVRLWAVVLGGMLVCGSMLLGACGAGQSAGPRPGTSGITATPGGTAAAARLTCTLHQEPVTADTVSATLSCAVTGAASDQTSFGVTYTTATAGAKGGADVSCGGPLHNGSGNCGVTFEQSAMSDKVGTVTGKLLPSQQHLGPVAPTPAR